MERLAVDRDVAVDRGDDVATKGDAPYRFRQVQRMGERVPSASRDTVPCRRRRWRSLGAVP
jgi:hypothetical protein